MSGTIAAQHGQPVALGCAVPGAGNRRAPNPEENRS